jgi:hypothetical protein
MSCGPRPRASGQYWCTVADVIMATWADIQRGDGRAPDQRRAQ